MASAGSESGRRVKGMNLCFCSLSGNTASQPFSVRRMMPMSPLLTPRFRSLRAIMMGSPTKSGISSFESCCLWPGLIPSNSSSIFQQRLLLIPPVPVGPFLLLQIILKSSRCLKRFPMNFPSSSAQQSSLVRVRRPLLAAVRPRTSARYSK